MNRAGKVEAVYLNIYSPSHYNKDLNGFQNFPGGSVVKNPPANAEDIGSIPGPGRSHMSRGN